MKLKENIKGFIFALIIIPLTVYAAKKISSGDIILGRGTPDQHRITSKQGSSNNPYLQFDDTANKWQFTNDGVVVKNLGSGEGSGGSGGINEILNPGFEDGFNVSWSNTGGTFSEETGAANVAQGEKSAKLVAAGAAEYFESDLATFTNASKAGVGCMADFFYKSGNNFDVKIIDGASNVVAQESIPADATDWSKFPTLTFPCEDDMKIRFESTAAGTIEVDNVYLGSNKGIIESAGAPEFFYIVPVPNFWDTAALTDDWDFSLAVPSFTTSKLITVADVSGQTKITANTQIKLDVSVSAQTTVNGTVSIYYNNNRIAGDQGDSLDGYFENAAASVVMQPGDHIILENGAQASRFGGLSITARKISTQTAFTPDQAEFFIDVNIGGANASNGTTATPSEASDGGWDMVVNKGSAKIPCSDINPPTGLTCSAGEEVMGVNFDAPVSGKYKICVNFQTSAGTGGSHAYRLAETPNNSATILQQGTSSVSMAPGNEGESNRLCDTFSLSTGNKTIKTFYETDNTSVIIADRAAGIYDRDIHITVELVGHNVSRPILTGDQVTTPGTNRPVIYSAIVDLTNPVPPITREVGDWLPATCVRPTSGTFNCTINAGAFASDPVCVVTAISPSNNVSCNLSGFSTVNLDGKCVRTNDGTVLDTPFSVMCHGLK